jgi:hypothetical protein
LLARVYQSGLVCLDHGLHSIAELEFGEDSLDVAFDRRFLHHQAPAFRS